VSGFVHTIGEFGIVLMIADDIPEKQRRFCRQQSATM